MTPQAPTTVLLPFRDPGFRANPYPFYERLRREHPVYRHPAGIYVVSRYEDVARLIRSPALGVQRLDFGAAEPLHHTMLGTDAPDHTRLRRLTNRWFTPKAVEGWLEVTRAVTASVLDEAADGVLDVADLALRSTFHTICHIFGIEPAGAAEVRQATYDIGLSLGPGADEADLRRTEEAFTWYDAHIRAILGRKREHPGDGMIDALLAAQAAGTVSEAEVIQTVLLFFAVGHLDVKHLINHGVWLMARDPALAEIYRTDPAARPGIVNEILRIDTPEQFVTRLTTEDVQVGGTVVSAGEVVILLIAAANKDPEVFPDPDRFDHTRPVAASQHLAFGSGMHGCAGQILARGEADAVFTALVTRFPAMELAGEPAFAHTEFLRTVTHLPVRLRKE